MPPTGCATWNLSSGTYRVSLSTKSIFSFFSRMTKIIMTLPTQYISIMADSISCIPEISRRATINPYGREKQ